MGFARAKIGLVAGTICHKNGTGRRVKFAKSLNRVYAENALPQVGKLPPGELAMLQAHGLRSWAIENLTTPKTITKRTKKPHAGEEQNQERKSHSAS